jgi:hypothetical protein
MLFWFIGLVLLFDKMLDKQFHRFGDGVFAGFIGSDRANAFPHKSA